MILTDIDQSFADHSKKCRINLRISLFNFCICDADSLFCHISFVKFFCIGKKSCVPFIFYFIKDLSYCGFKFPIVIRTSFQQILKNIPSS